MAVIAMGALPTFLQRDSAGGRKSSSWSLAVCKARVSRGARSVAVSKTSVVTTFKRERVREIGTESTDEDSEEDGKVLYELSQEEEEDDDEDEDDVDDTEDEDEEDEEDEDVDSRPAENEIAIAKLGLSKELVNGLAERGMTQLFPIQRAVFEPAMKGSDIIARAKTGTGKTLAFGVPIMDSIYQERRQSKRRASRGPVALILAPTRELAKQVEQEFVESGKDLATVCVYGGVSIISQKRLLSRGVDIAVGTPGRVIDLLEQGCLDLKEVKFMVLDEADRMLAVGFEEDVERIMEELPAKRQSMLFSATMPSWVQKLSKKFLNKPVTIDLIGDSAEKLAEGIKLFAVQSSRAGKRKILSDVITVYGKGGKTIVFTETKRDAEEVCMAMNRSLGCESLHGDIAQFQREKTLAAFREAKFLILVATDVAARGLDITDVDLVIHYDLPRDSETFVHRSGRTGRAGKDGRALVLYSPEQKRSLKQIEREVGCSFQFRNVPLFEEVLKSSSAQAVELIKNVHPELQKAFLDTAEKLLEEQGTGAFAAAIAHMSGFSQPPPARSLITLEPGFVTLKFTRAEGKMPLATRNVVGAIASLFEKAADNMGKVQLIDERNVEGAVFDLPEEIAKDLLTKSVPSGTKIEVIKELPSLQDSWEDNQRSSFGRRPSGRFDNFRSNNSSSRFDNSRSGSSSGRFDSFRSSSSNGRGPPRYGDSDGRSSRSSSSYDSFSGTCYKCGKSGHRAFECGR